MLGWLDLIALALLVMALLRGKQRGMSEELLPLLKWLVILILGSQAYEIVGQLVHDVSGIDLAYCRVGFYLLQALVVSWAFNALKHAVGDKILTADAFGKSEFVLGMLGCALKYTCILLFCLALVHSIYTNEEKKAANAKMQQESFGNINFPTIATLKDDAFIRSFLGPYIERYAHNLLLQPVTPTGQRKETIGKKREKVLDEIISPK